MFFWPHLKSSFKTPDHLVCTSSFSRNESICFFISYTTAGVSPASIKIFFSRPWSLRSHTFSEVLRDIIGNYWLLCSKNDESKYHVSLIFHLAYLFSMDKRSNPSAPASSAPEIKSKDGDCQSLFIFFPHKPNHCDSHDAELKIPNGSLLQSEATTSSL